MALPPQFIIIGGGNGAGKSTSAALILGDQVPYINADEIAKGLPEVEGENKDARASRILIILISAMGEHEARREELRNRDHARQSLARTSRPAAARVGLRVSTAFLLA